MSTTQLNWQMKSQPPPEPNCQTARANLSPILISYDDLHELGITYSREHFRRLEADGKFPSRVRLSPSRVAWMFHEVMAWLNDRADARTHGPE